MNYHRSINNDMGDKMTHNLVKRLSDLQAQSDQFRCHVCSVVASMDKETKEAFFDVIDSRVTIQAITSAMVSEGFKVSRFQLGEVRRNCATGNNKECLTFKGEKK